VAQGMTFITDRDRIVKFDAQQAHTDEVDAQKDQVAKGGDGKDAGKDKKTKGAGKGTEQ
jgi:hypothetical protein